MCIRDRSYLIPELQTLIDDNKIGMMTGVELSYLTTKEQRDVWDEMELTAFEHYPNKAQAVDVYKRQAIKLRFPEYTKGE